MEDATKIFIVISSVKNKNIIAIIPKLWIINKESTDLVVGHNYEWHWPTEEKKKKAEAYVNVNKNWDIEFGQILHITGNKIIIYILFL